MTHNIITVRRKLMVKVILLPEVRIIKQGMKKIQKAVSENWKHM